MRRSLIFAICFIVPRKELKIKEGAEKLRDVSKDRRSLSELTALVKKSSIKLSEMQQELQELDSQIILTHGGFPAMDNGHSTIMRF